MRCPWELVDCVQNAKILDEKCKTSNFVWNDKMETVLSFVQACIVLLAVDSDGWNNLMELDYQMQFLWRKKGVMQCALTHKSVGN